MTGVNLVGPFDANSGLGEAARGVMRALEHAGVPFVSRTYPQAGGDRLDPRSDVSPYDTTVICLQPDQLAAFAAQVGSDFFANRTTIGLWFWESTVFADRYRRALQLVDRIWVTSDHVRRVLERATSAPVRVVLLPVEESRHESIPRSDLGLPEHSFLFLTMFDFVSVRRKNPYAVVEAYRRAFDPGSGATLVLKTINGRSREPHLLAELERAVADREDIVVMDGYVSAAQRDALIGACDCLVSLHRAEGLGLPLLEAMRLGKPVVATGFSGNLDFMDDGSSYLVPFRLVPVPEGEMVHAHGAEWAEPSVEIAASHMRRVFDDRDGARAVGAVARRTVLDRYSLDRSATVLAAELERAGAGSRTAASARRRRAIVDASLALARDPTLAHARGWTPVALLRRFLVRALWPYLAAQRERDEAMLEGLTEIERSLADVEAHLAAIVGEELDEVSLGGTAVSS